MNLHKKLLVLFVLIGTVQLLAMETKVRTSIATEQLELQERLNKDFDDACRKEDIAACQQALSAGADPFVQIGKYSNIYRIYHHYFHARRDSVKTKNEKSAFQAQAWLGLIKILFDHPKFDINQRFEEETAPRTGSMVLHIVVEEDDVAFLEFILEKFPQVQVNNNQNKYKQTPLNTLLHTDIWDSETKKTVQLQIKLLLAHGADPHIQDDKGQDCYAMLENSYKDRRDLSAVIQEHRAAYIKTRIQDTAQQVAETTSLNSSLCKLIGDYAIADKELPLQKDVDLYRAVENNDSKAVAEALALGANINCKNAYSGDTPLHCAIKAASKKNCIYDIAIIKQLVSWPLVMMDVKNNREQTPLLMAVDVYTCSYTKSVRAIIAQIIDLLLQFGADPALKGMSSGISSYWLAEGGSSKFLESLKKGRADYLQRIQKKEAT